MENGFPVATDMDWKVMFLLPQQGQEVDILLSVSGSFLFLMEYTTDMIVKTNKINRKNISVG